MVLIAHTLIRMGDLIVVDLKNYLINFSGVINGD